MDLTKVSIFKMLIAFCEQSQINIKIPFRDLEEHQKKSILHEPSTR